MNKTTHPTTTKKSNIYKALYFALVFCLAVMGGGNLYGQTSGRKQAKHLKKEIAKYNKKHPRQTLMFLNTIVAVNENGILVEDVKTKQERVITIYNTNSSAETFYLADIDLPLHGAQNITKTDACIILCPGDVVAVKLDARLIPNNKYTLAQDVKVSAQEYYDNYKILSGDYVVIKVYDKESYMKRKRDYDAENANKEFETIKQQITNEEKSR